MRRAAAAIALGAVVVALAAGCGGGTQAPREDVGVFMTRILREEIDGQWSRQWTELHPGHQKLISRAAYVECSKEIGTNFGTNKERFKVVAVENDSIHVRGVPQTSAKLVTITVRRPGAPLLTYRLHAVSLGDRWAWILGQRFLDAIGRGRCLDGSRLQSNT